MIKAAAIMHEGVVYTGVRHGEIGKYMIQRLQVADKIYSGANQGFVNDKNQYLTRGEALLEARACGQVDKIIGGVLTSEDLW